jgi:hypothetical protein
LDPSRCKGCNYNFADQSLEHIEEILAEVKKAGKLLQPKQDCYHVDSVDVVTQDKHPEQKYLQEEEDDDSGEEDDQL